MTCSQCGAPLKKDDWYCPECGAELTASEMERSKKKSRAGRNFVLIFSLSLLIPNLICLAVNFLTGLSLFWSGYVILVSAFVWMCVCFPFIRFGNLTIKMLLCGIVPILFVLLIASMTDGFGWFIRYALPICGTLLLLTVGLTELIRSKKITGLHIASGACIAVMLFLNVIDLTVHLNMGVFKINWSIITDAVFVSVALLLEGIAYIIKKNRED